MKYLKNIILMSIFCFGFQTAKANGLDSLGLKKENNITFLVYKVDPNQTLFNVLQKYNISFAEFKKFNEFTEIPLKEGDIVFIPLHYLEEKKTELVVIKSPQEKEEEKANSGPKTHLVEVNQGLLTVANLYNVTMQQIRNWNNLSIDKLSPGQKLIVEDPSKFTEVAETNSIAEKFKDKKVVEIGIAELIEVPDNSGKFLALHQTAPVGTSILVTNLANKESIWVKVVGKLPNNGSKTIIKISSKAFEKLNAIDKRIRVETSYLLP